MKLLKCCIIMILCFFAAQHADAKKYIVQGQIFDAESKARLADADITFVNARTGKILGLGKDSGYGLQHNADSWFYLYFYADPNETFPLRIEVELDGYRTATLTYDFSASFPEMLKIEKPINMVKGNADDDMEVNLNEVVVTATKIKMVMKGDTIVYDADAFRLSEGSMLDALIGQLPGAELDDNGQITVNGKKISSLLVDGKDFFTGDPNVALRNLPAYTVKNVKVYDRTNPFAAPGKFVGEQDKDLVMDVNLKKQYQMGFVGNIEGGYGSSDRYLGRLFALEYTRKVRLSAYANINNINNDSRGPGITANDGVIMDNGWQEATVNEGERKLIRAGLDYHITNTDNPDDRYVKELIFNGSTSYSRTVTDIDRHISTSDFLAGIPNRFGRSGTRDNNTAHEVSSLNSLMYWFNSNLLWLKPNFRYYRGDGHSMATTAQFLDNPVESRLGEAIDSVSNNIDGVYARRYGLLYLDNNSEHRKNREVTTDGRFYSNINAFNPFGFGVIFDWRYTDRHYDADRRQNVTFKTEDIDPVIRNSITSEPFRDWSYAPALRLTYSGDSYSAEISDRVTMGGTDGSREIILPDDPLTPLESYMIDNVNSYFSRERTKSNAIYGLLQSRITLTDMYNLDLTADCEMENGTRRLKYQRDEIDTTFSRSHVLVRPSLTLRLNNDDAVRKVYTIKVNARQTLPQMTRLLRSVDTTDPMSIRLGNPDLKKMTRLMAMASVEINNMTSKSMLRASVDYSHYWNRMADYKMYDPTTGISTYQPVNVSGSYIVNGSVNFSFPFTRAQKLWFSTVTTVSYNYNPDFISIDGSSSAISTVINNTYLTENISLRWDVVSGVKVALNLGAQWRSATSDTQGFNNINIWNLKSGATASARLPLGFELATDFTYHSRRGYDDNALNKNYIVWNARLERSFLKGALNAKIDAYDILGQISNVDAQVNSLGLTETWTNSMSRYVLLTLAWRFSIMPHK